MTLEICYFVESDPYCRTNTSVLQSVEESNHVEIECSVRYKGVWTPHFDCVPHIPGNFSVSQTVSDLMVYRRIIPASSIQDFTVLNCSMAFTLATNYLPACQSGSLTPDKPHYKYVWNSTTIHVINATGTLATYAIYLFI